MHVRRKPPEKCIEIRKTFSHPPRVIAAPDRNAVTDVALLNATNSATDHVANGADDARWVDSERSAKGCSRLAVVLHNVERCHLSVQRCGTGLSHRVTMGAEGPMNPAVRGLYDLIRSDGISAVKTMVSREHWENLYDYYDGDY